MVLIRDIRSFSYFCLYCNADAAGVRRAAGKQAEVINKLIYSTDVKVEKELKVLLGHTPIQVFQALPWEFWWALYLLNKTFYCIISFHNL